MRCISASRWSTSRPAGPCRHRDRRSSGPSGATSPGAGPDSSRPESRHRHRRSTAWRPVLAGWLGARGGGRDGWPVGPALRREVRAAGQRSPVGDGGSQSQREPAVAVLVHVVAADVSGPPPPGVRQLTPGPEVLVGQPKPEHRVTGVEVAALEPLGDLAQVGCVVVGPTGAFGSVGDELAELERGAGREASDRERRDARSAGRGGCGTRRAAPGR